MPEKKKKDDTTETQPELGSEAWIARFESDVELAALEYGPVRALRAISRALAHGFPKSGTVPNVAKYLEQATVAVRKEHGEKVGAKHS